jgi:hypothetical protein
LDAREGFRFRCTKTIFPRFFRTLGTLFSRVDKVKLWPICRGFLHLCCSSS